jgi:predicted nucleic acid-binding protein
MIVILDSGILGKLCNPNNSPATIAVREWLFSLLAKGVRVVTNYVCDYEVRRSLILNSQKGLSSEGINNLDKLADIIEFLPVKETIWKAAAQLWAEARLQGIPTTDDKNLDADVIICAQWKLLTEEFPGRYIVIATTNVKHLTRFTEAKQWQEIEF